MESARAPAAREWRTGARLCGGQRDEYLKCLVRCHSGRECAEHGCPNGARPAAASHAVDVQHLPLPRLALSRALRSLPATLPAAAAHPLRQAFTQLADDLLETTQRRCREIDDGVVQQLGRRAARLRRHPPKLEYG